MQAEDAIELNIAASASDIKRFGKFTAFEFARLAKEAKRKQPAAFWKSLILWMVIAMFSVVLTNLVFGPSGPGWSAFTLEVLVNWLPMITLCAGYACLVGPINKASVRRYIDRVTDAINLPANEPLHSVVRLTPDAIEMRTPGVLSCRYEKTAIHSIAEDGNDLVVFARLDSIAIPKHAVAAEALQAFRRGLADWAYPKPVLRRPPRIGSRGRIALACFLGVLAFGVMRYRSQADAGEAWDEPATSISMPLADEILNLPNGRARFSSISFRLEKRPERAAHLDLTGALTTADLHGWTGIQALRDGFTTLPMSEDLGNPKNYYSEIPAAAAAVRSELPDGGAQAIWIKADERCASMKQYGERVPNSTAVPRYRRTIYVSACSLTLSHDDLLAWEKGAIPGLMGRPR